MGSVGSVLCHFLNLVQLHLTCSVWFRSLISKHIKQSEGEQDKSHYDFQGFRRLNVDEFLIVIKIQIQLKTHIKLASVEKLHVINFFWYDFVCWNDTISCPSFIVWKHLCVLKKNILFLTLLENLKEQYFYY